MIQIYKVIGSCISVYKFHMFVLVCFERVKGYNWVVWNLLSFPRKAYTYTYIIYHIYIYVCLASRLACLFCFGLMEQVRMR